MKNFIMLSAIAGVLGLMLPSGSASAEPRHHHRCTVVKKFHWHHGKRVCEKHTVRRDRHNH